MPDYKNPFIQRVQIKNFRNYLDVDVTLDHKQVIIGENNVGKTNFLRAIQLILDRDFSDNWQNFEVQIIEQIINDSRSRAKPKIWIENIISQYLKEKTVLPPPQLSIASWITAGLCTNLLFCIAIGQKVKYYPKFYLSSIIDDRN